MPKQPTIQRPHQRPAPYHQRTSSAMVTHMPQTMGPWNPSMHNMGYSDHMHYPQQHVMPTMYLPAPNTMPAAHQMQREPLPKPGQSGPWNNEEDCVLIDAKGRGMSWEEIHRTHFPGKSANACRKRHERVLAKMRNTDWDDARIQRVTDAYNRHRHTIWAPLCKELNENLSDVEKVVGRLYPFRTPSKLIESNLDVPTRSSQSQEPFSIKPCATSITSEFRSRRIERV